MKQAPIIPRINFKSESLSLKVQTIKNFSEAQDDLSRGPHSHDYYEMVWLSQGCGDLYADLRRSVIKPNTIFCLKPNQAHQFQIHPEMEGFVFSFTSSFFKMDEYDFNWGSQASLYQLFCEERTLTIPTEMEEELNDIALKMIAECENRLPHRLDVLKRYFKIFLIYITRTVDEVSESPELPREELVRSFMDLLDTHYKDKKMVADYAGQLLVTPNYLNRIVKKNTGYAAGHHIRQRIVLEAKRLGRYSGAGMKEIAYSLGFEDSAHFSKFFKTFGGTNFSEFKKEALVVPMVAVVNRA